MGVDTNFKPQKNPPKAIDKIEGQLYDDSKLLARIDKLEEGHRSLKEIIEFVKDANWVLLIVLGLGFIALIISFISLVIQATNSSTATQIELIKSITELRNTVDKVNLPTPILTISPLPTQIPTILPTQTL